MEYFPQFWDPHTATHTDLLEDIQNRAVRFSKKLQPLIESHLWFNSS